MNVLILRIECSTYHNLLLSLGIELILSGDFFRVRSSNLLLHMDAHSLVLVSSSHWTTRDVERLWAAINMFRTAAMTLTVSHYPPSIPGDPPPPSLPPFNSIRKSRPMFECPRGRIHSKHSIKSSSNFLLHLTRFLEVENKRIAKANAHPSSEIERDEERIHSGNLERRKE